MTDEPVIPPHLLTYRDEDWMPRVEDSVTFPALRARELQRIAQDRWANAHGMWRDRFEALQAKQQGQT
ncbi:hypothetical protein amrb99_63270 [Actinomadura sp. RB99]|uniref:hypothetical protein n=1 Tax=Actinomadura sp. RB99 TaxID=2691577 RepID=UPI00168893AA|nr:hypothetical protein [Actinomadura sp. RB99]MBD2897367.1 hypothetical protein [Actinomadura sp. RB99]